MKYSTLFPRLLLASLLAATVGLAGCQADGDGIDGGSIIDDGSNNGFGPNNGTVGSEVTDGGDPDGNGPLTEGPEFGGNFVCNGSTVPFDATATIVANGLLGAPLQTLLDNLGADTTTFLAGGSDAQYAVDGRLATAAKLNLVVDLGNLLATVGVTATMGEVPAGNYAVAGVTLPISLLELTLFSGIVVETFNNGVSQESVTLDRTALNLLGTINAGRLAAWVGFANNEAYDELRVSLRKDLLTANAVDDALHVHELCTSGYFVAAP